MKKILCSIIAIMLLCAIIPVAASEEIKVQIDGEYIVFDDVYPQIVEGRTLVPFRKIFEYFKMNISFDETTKTVVASYEEDYKIQMTIDSPLAFVLSGQNTYPVPLDVPAQIISDRTMVPLRFVGEILGLNVSWDSVNRTVVMININSVYDVVYNNSPIFASYASSPTYKPVKGVATSVINVNGTIKSQDGQEGTLSGAINGTLAANEGKFYTKTDTSFKDNGFMSKFNLSGDILNFKEEEIQSGTDNYKKTDMFKIFYPNKEGIQDVWLLTENYTNGDLNLTIKDYLDILFNLAVNKNAITKDSYNNMKSTAERVSSILNSDNFNMSIDESGNYVVSINVDSLDLKSEENAKFAFDGKLSIKGQESIIQGVVCDSTAKLNITGKLTVEGVSYDFTFELDGKTTYDENASMTITVPTENVLDNEGFYQRFFKQE